MKAGRLGHLRHCGILLRRQRRDPDCRGAGWPGSGLHPVAAGAGHRQGRRAHRADPHRRRREPRLLPQGRRTLCAEGEGGGTADLIVGKFNE